MNRIPCSWPAFVRAQRRSARLTALNQCFRSLTTSPISTNPSKPSAKSFLEVVKSRRSFYKLDKKTSVKPESVVEVIKTTVLHCPSSFNSQSTRLLVLLNKDHDKLWDITKDVLQAQVPSEQFEVTRKKLNGFRAAVGTILCYEDPKPVRELQAKFPLYSAKFPQWAEHTNGMHQYILWAALESEGFGCNLQHYNPLIDQRIAAEWKVDPEWSLKGQLVFGNPVGEPNEKFYQPWEDRVHIHGL